MIVRNKTSGFSLIEITVTMIIATIMVLSITLYFVAEHNFREMIKERTTVVREARIAMNHLTETFRFVNPADITSAGTDQIVADIDGVTTTFERLDIGTVNTDRTNVIERRTSVDDAAEIARDITVLEFVWADPYLEIELTAAKGNQSIPLHTKIKVLGEQ